jgi:hypothetical protein
VPLCGGDARLCGDDVRARTIVSAGRSVCLRPGTTRVEIASSHSDQSD